MPYKFNRSSVLIQVFIVTVLLFSIVFPSSPIRAAEVIPQAVTGTPVCTDFNQIQAGTSVEGLGTVYPWLDISTTGNAVAINEQGNPFAYQAPNSNPIPNLGVSPFSGFFDEQKLHDYTFSFSPGFTVNLFTIKMLDYGDRNEHFATEHEVSLVAYDDGGTIVDIDTLAYTSDATLNPHSGSAGDLYITGDAATQSGNPGNYTFSVSGDNISHLEMQFTNNVAPSHSDSFFGLAILCFVPETVTPPSGVECANFASLEAGMLVEGLGVVHPDLSIDTTGTAIAIEEGVDPFAYQGPNVGTPIPNLGIDPFDGFYDQTLQHEYSFSFVPGKSVDYFTIKMLDYGDRNEDRATEHVVSLVAYDADNNVVDVDTMTYTSDTALNPHSGSAGDLYLTGDAATQPGNPGNYTFAVEGEGITNLELEFSNNVADSHSDSFFGLAVLCFETSSDPGTELDPPTAELTMLRPKTTPEVGGKFLVEYACSETAPNLVSATINGYDVANGQEVNLVIREHESARVVGGTLVWLFAPEFNMNVTCADDLGNEVSTDVQPEFIFP